MPRPRAVEEWLGALTLLSGKRQSMSETGNFHRFGA
jgi:hypothetical protein